MKKNLLITIVVCLSTTLLFARSIDANYALQVAQNFYNQTASKSLTLSLAYQCNNTDASNGVPVGEPLYYAFNVAGNNGFVIISADDLVKPVIGYNTKGQFVIQKAPPVIADWFVKYSKQIAYAKVNSTSTTAEISQQWTNYYNNIANTTKQARAGGAVGPLLTTTTWDQDLYYNDFCPSDAGSPQGYGGHVPTGCGATAMSQIMRYWGYPAQGTGNQTYNSGYGSLSANFGTTTYNWANMPNSLTSPNTDVATIMYDCGVAVEMDYEAQESLSYMTGAAPSCQNAYTTFFGYDPATIQGLIRANYATTDWTNLIQTELDNARPVQYAGSGPQGGHTFVLDGSDGNGNFHVNWGWSGTDNGYYSIDALDPSPYANGSFDANESLIIGIKPLNITVTSSGIDLYAAIVVTPNPIAFDQTFTVTTNLINNGTSGFNGAYCAALFDASGNFIRYIGDILNTNGTALAAGYYYNGGLTFADTTQAVTVPGTYTIGIYYQATGSNTWTLAGASTFTNPITVTVDGPQDAIALYSDILASPATLQQGQSATISANLVNNGTSTYLGQYEAVLLDLEGNFVEQIGAPYTESTGLQVGYAYNSPIPFTIGNVTAPEGEYILAIAESPSGSGNWYYCGGQTYKNPVLINVVNPGINILSVNDVSSNLLKVYPNPASNVITIEAGGATGNYTLKIFNSIGQQMNESNGVLNGQKLTTDVSDYAGGMYVIQLKTEAGTLNSKFIVR